MIVAKERMIVWEQVMMNFLRDFESSLGIKITCSQETEPMGTAGPLALAREKLDDGSGEAFFVLNSDVISEYPLKQMIEFHKKHGGEATIMVTKVSFQKNTFPMVIPSFSVDCCKHSKENSLDTPSCVDHLLLLHVWLAFLSHEHPM